MSYAEEKVVDDRVRGGDSSPTAVDQEHSGGGGRDILHLTHRYAQQALEGDAP